MLLPLIPRFFGSGSVLAVDVTAPEPLPPFPASTMDGYAVVASDGEAVLEVRAACAAVCVCAMFIKRAVTLEERCHRPSSTREKGVSWAEDSTKRLILESVCNSGGVAKPKRVR